MWVVGIKECCKTVSYTASIVQTTYTLVKTETTVQMPRCIDCNKISLTTRKLEPYFNIISGPIVLYRKKLWNQKLSYHNTIFISTFTVD